MVVASQTGVEMSETSQARELRHAVLTARVGHRYGARDGTRHTSGASDAASPLARLRLSDAQLRSLATQGTVCAERRASGFVCYKLRFRDAGRQCVRYLGTDLAVADQLRAEVHQLQTKVRRRRELARLGRRVRDAMRRTKQQMAPFAIEAGLAFHGLALRSPRRTAVGEAGQFHSEHTVT